jgi:predicted phage baseplate assembly protein
LGVKAVINPIEASGGADRETCDQARDNAPLAVQALDRLVSVSDYADFTRTFAGIGKAVASKLSNGRRQLVYITIAGADDIPIEITSDLYLNLLSALHQLGDPDLALQVERRELIVLAVSANIRLVDGYLWEPVKANITAAILDAFGFQHRALAQPALLCELIALIQNIPGVEYVDVDGFNGISENSGDGNNGFPTLNEISTALTNADNQPHDYIPVNDAGVDKNGVIHPAQLAIFTASVPDTIVLNQIS